MLRVAHSAAMQTFSFPMLPLKEICETCAEVSIALTEEDLKNPADWKVKQLYEQFIELLLNQRRDEMAQPAFSGMQELENPELHEESIPMISFLKAWCAHRMPGAFRPIAAPSEWRAHNCRTRAPCPRQPQAALHVGHHRLQARRHPQARRAPPPAQPLGDHQLCQVPRGAAALL